MSYGTQILDFKPWTSDYPGASGVMGFKLIKARTRTGTVTPNLKSIPRDEKPINPYFDHQYTLEQPLVVHLVYVHAETGEVMSHGHGGDFDQNSATTEYTNMVADCASFMESEDSIRNRLTLAALKKIADTKVNLVVSLKEAAKTSDLILGTATKLYQAWRSFRRGDVVGVAKALDITPKKSHSNFLSYKYGWMPMLMDIKGAAEFLAQQSLGGRKERFTVSVKLKDLYATSHTEDLSGFSPGSKRDFYTKLDREYRVKIWCELSNQHLSHMQQLGLTNPALYAWEVIPFSFAFDWICSVGDYLTGLSALHGVNVRRAMFTSTKAAVGTRYTFLRGETVGSTQRLDFGNWFTFNGRAYSRDPLVVDPFSLYPPVQNPIDSINRLVTGLALLRTQARR